MQPARLRGQAGELLLAASLLQPGRGVAVAGVGIGDRREPRDGLIPLPGVGGRERLCIAGGELLLAAGVFQLAGGVRLAGLVGEDLAQQLDRLIPPVRPERGQRPVVQRLHLGFTGLLAWVARPRL